MQTRLAEEAAARRKLHNDIMDLKGAIRVLCRRRPMSPTELAAGAVSAADVDEIEGVIDVVVSSPSVHAALSGASCFSGT
jgi:kinesin family protein C1